MQKTHTWYELIITSIIFIFGTALGVITLLGPLSLPQVQTPESIFLNKQFILLIVGPLTYALSLLNYHGISALVRRCIHAGLLGMALILLPNSIIALFELLKSLSPYQPNLSSFPSLSFITTLVLGVSITLAYFALLSFVDWQLRRNYISTFPAIFGLFWAIAVFSIVAYSYAKNPKAFMTGLQSYNFSGLRHTTDQELFSETSEDLNNHHQGSS
jgi:hypothetical protein